MTDIERRVKLKQLAAEINKRCYFFRIMTDSGISSPKPRPKEEVTKHPKK
jgi:hypothetical protein